ncbi:MAG TPA: ABC transporter permease [Pyrinomonadaceae bacterium]|nr:ABC transporter permease [Pyrinomonadaceae bacterium]
MIEEQTQAPGATVPASATVDHSHSRDLSVEPMIKIRPGKARVRSSLSEVWTHRELLYFLVWRDLKVRYKQTVLGAAWVILQPLLMAIIFTVFLSKLVRVPSDGVPYPLFAYAGLLPWMFFSNAVAISSSGLLANSYMITKVYFPRIIIPMALVGVRLIDFLTASSMLVLMMLYYRIEVGRSLLVLPLFFLLTTVLTLGFGVWFSVLNVKYRDVGSLLPLLLQVWMFASPIIYPSNLVPGQWRLIYSLNPLAGLIEGFRASLFNLPFDWTSIGISAAVIVVLFIYFVQAFCRIEEDIVDII